jgi:diadenosine tetraphosphate (Ap4A) HIT family hydrolase
MAIALEPTTVFEFPKTSVLIPAKQLAKESVQIVAKDVAADYGEIYTIMQRILHGWKEDNIATQFLIYSKIDEKAQNFELELVPFKKSACCISRIFRQIVVLLRTIFECLKVKLSKEKRTELASKFKKYFTGSKLPPAVSTVHTKSNDHFCNAEVLDKQRVFSGHKVEVLFDYAPIGLGKEKFHFLILPKSHRADFGELTQEEFVETFQVAEKLTAYLNKNKGVNTFYELGKKGTEAGQTVLHAHLHLIGITSKVADCIGKCTVAKKILFGGSPMKKEALAKRVAELAAELKGVLSTPAA